MQLPSLKIAAISDIHSNIFALNAVLADIESQNVDYIVNLGDILYGPIAPKATYERLLLLHENHPNLITIRGNQDRQIYEAFNDDAKLELTQNPTMQFIFDDLPMSAFKWLQDLPFDYYLNQNKVCTSIYLCHGSPTDDMTYLLEDVSSGFPCIRSDSELIRLLDGITAKLIVCGHTHIPRSVTVSTGQLIVNTGSVGYPAYQDDLPNLHNMQTYSPHANYAILEIDIDTHCINDKPQWKVVHKSIPYDYISAAQMASKNGRKDWEFALMTGRAGI